MCFFELTHGLVSSFKRLFDISLANLSTRNTSEHASFLQNFILLVIQIIFQFYARSFVISPHCLSLFNDVFNLVLGHIFVVFNLNDIT